MTDDLVIEVKELHKSYGKLEALKGLSFGLKRGSVLGVTGANGAGKTTLFDILATLDLNFKGEVKIAGFQVIRDYHKIRKLIGYVPGSFSLYPDLTLAENISFFAKMYGSSPGLHTESPFWESLMEFANKRADTLSGGMKQKLAIICAMVHSPEILFLDEPTTGIDSDSRAAIFSELRKLKERGTTVIVSTHYYEEFDYVDSLLVLHEGRQLNYCTMDEIRERFRGDGIYEKFLEECLIRS
ncbi:hypothetical protein MASR1M46_11440 [Bacteroidales bacterium]